MLPLRLLQLPRQLGLSRAALAVPREAAAEGALLLSAVVVVLPVMTLLLNLVWAWVWALA